MDMGKFEIVFVVSQMYVWIEGCIDGCMDEWIVLV